MGIPSLDTMTILTDAVRRFAVQNFILDFNLDGPVRPGEPVQFSWRVRTYRANRDMGNVAVRIYSNEFPGVPLYDRHESVTIRGTRAFNTDTGIQRGTISPPSDDVVGRRFYRIGEKRLTFELTGDGPDGAAILAEDTLEVVSEGVDSSWWTWTFPNRDGSAEMNWKQAYTLGGVFRNRSEWSVLDTSIYLIESELRSGATTRERIERRIDADSTGEITFRPITQQWEWFVPRIWLVTSGFPRHFEYQVRIDIADPYRNTYEALVSSSFNVVVSIPAIKLAAAITAKSLVAVAAALLIVAGLKLLGVITAPLAPAAFAAAAWTYTAASMAGAIAADPPEPDKSFKELVEPIVPALPDVLIKDQELKPLVEALHLVLSILAVDEALTKTEGKLLGAQSVGDSMWIQTQSDHYRELLKQMIGAENRFPDSVSMVSATFRGEQVFDPKEQVAIWGSWRKGIPEDMRKLGQESGFDLELVGQLEKATLEICRLTESTFLGDQLEKAVTGLAMFVAETTRRAEESKII